jgi:hypothetical protein
MMMSRDTSGQTLTMTNNRDLIERVQTGGINYAKKKENDMHIINVAGDFTAEYDTG